MSVLKQMDMLIDQLRDKVWQCNREVEDLQRRLDGSRDLYVALNRDLAELVVARNIVESAGISTEYTVDDDLTVHFDAVALPVGPPVETANGSQR